MPRPAQPSKYQPLGDWLALYAGATVTLTFTEVEAILGFRLPSTARADTSWWTHQRPRDPHARVWHTAGWRMQQVDRRQETVTFTRREEAPP